MSAQRRPPAERYRRNYVPSFLQYLARRGEPALEAAHVLGRSAVAEGVPLLEVVQVHHRALADAVASSRPEYLPDLVVAAGEFLGNVVMTFEMSQRAYAEAHGLRDRASDASGNGQVAQG